MNLVNDFIKSGPFDCATRRAYPGAIFSDPSEREELYVKNSSLESSNFCSVNSF